jgi:predicted DCC family thiol-disulfide oxidoreductase YuxK
MLRYGSLVQGADVYRHVMRRIWWARPLYLLACAPGLRCLFDAGYRAFATHRPAFPARADCPAPTRPAERLSPSLRNVPPHRA